MNVSGKGWTGEVLVKPDEPKYAHVQLTLWSQDEETVRAALDFCIALLGLGRQRYIRRNPEIEFCGETEKWQGYTRFSYRTDIGREETTVKVPYCRADAILSNTLRGFDG